ncbi:hypothetical protein AB6D23_20860, partial [Vibrio splendidus]
KQAKWVGSISNLITQQSLFNLLYFIRGTSFYVAATIKLRYSMSKKYCGTFDVSRFNLKIGHIQNQHQNDASAVNRKP